MTWVILNITSSSIDDLGDHGDEYSFPYEDYNADDEAADGWDEGTPSKSIAKLIRSLIMKG
ncbi:hypothetical protein BGX30_006094 [Mortierella sp. GBA39]|nr:hypothetical protein BGX30_006094 [Mortierella sp. GBA39]